MDSHNLIRCHPDDIEISYHWWYKLSVEAECLKSRQPLEPYQSPYHPSTAIHQFTNPSYTTTKHRKDSPEGRMKRDAADLDEVSSKPVVWSPF